MRNYKEELEKRVEFIKNTLQEARATGIVFGNSGGKDSALAGILCKIACENTLGIMMPCESKRNFESDMQDAIKVAEKFKIECITIDLTEAKHSIVKSVEKVENLSADATKNIPPRLRMTTVYAVAQSRNALVCGTGNRSETYMGYFTKWGDGGCDFNPISDLTVTEIYEFLEFLEAPKEIIEKAPSAGLFEGQTDEQEMGISYQEIDKFLLNGEKGENYLKIEKAHNATNHKRKLPKTYA